MPGRSYDCASLRVSISSNADRAAAVQELQAFFEVVRHRQSVEIWVSYDRFPSLCALVHGEFAWLMYLRYEGDPGFSSRNTAFKGAPDQTIEYMLSNGQMDEYPASWAYSTETVFDALLAFAREGRVPTSIVWFNDSGDGTARPNDVVDASRSN